MKRLICTYRVRKARYIIYIIIINPSAKRREELLLHPHRSPTPVLRITKPSVSSLRGITPDTTPDDDTQQKSLLNPAYKMEAACPANIYSSDSDTTSDSNDDTVSNSSSSSSTDGPSSSSSSMSPLTSDSSDSDSSTDDSDADFKPAVTEKKVITKEKAPVVETRKVVNGENEENAENSDTVTTNHGDIGREQSGKS